MKYEPTARGVVIFCERCNGFRKLEPQFRTYKAKDGSYKVESMGTQIAIEKILRKGCPLCLL